jgi:high-affinity iron transporter
MLATLVIGLREGLEASLIVGIIAAFLRRTGKPLRPMWIGVAIAIALSVIVGVILEVVSAELPQAQQEGMESIIGLVAVAVVTGMIGWMNAHARNMKHDLEAHAASALRDGTAWALVGMAFLAVLKEGFETSVFLLAAFQSSTSALAAGAGAVIGIGIAVAIGIGIFRGGVRLNLARFFRITGLFLVFVAAGLVLSSLRTAHEAGWITIGQQSTLNLSWLAPSGSVQAALLTGVLGIPADPRLIEVLGWLAYLVPVLAYLLWPVALRPGASALPRFRFGMAAALGAAALILAVAIPLPGSHSASPAPLVGGGHAMLGSADGRTTLTTDKPRTSTTFQASDTTATVHDGVSSRVFTSTHRLSVADRPTSISLTDLVALSGGRVPIGVNASQNPGPFTARWSSTVTTSVWTVGGTLLDAQSDPKTLVTISGGGLPSARTISPSTSASPGASASPSTSASSGFGVQASYPASVTAGIGATAASRSELLLWKLWLPIVLALAAIVVGGYGMRSRIGLKRRALPQANSPAPQPRAAPAPARV